MKTMIANRLSDSTLLQLSQLQGWWETNQTETLARAIAGSYETELASRKASILEKLQSFARQYSDKGELTEEETGYAHAMLEVAGVLGLKLDETTDALLDHIEASKL